MKITIGIFIGVIFACICAAVDSCRHNKDIIKNDKYYDSIQNIKIDSVKKLYENNIVKLLDIVKEKELLDIERRKDIINLEIELDSINEELIIAKYKLNRIEYYNTIAAKNNNIKFLRGWINRVIKEQDEN